MKIIWDEDKNEVLKQTRGVSFEEIAGIIMEKRYVDIIKNPTRPGQRYFVLRMRDYTWIVPFVVDDDEAVVLKTAFPSRKYHKQYGGS